MSDVPKHIGRYAVERLIGEGGMARVYLAHAQSASGFTRAVAIKVLQEHLRGDASFERMLIAEAKLGGLLRHEGLVAAHELGLHEGSYFVCMEYVDGLSVREVQQEQLLSSDAAHFIVAKLALALHYLHSYAGPGGEPLGLVHRDISPSNLLLSRSGQVKLIDLGIAKATSLVSGTQANLLKGTYAYMSPEQIAGESLSAASDIFSLGSLYFEMLTGKRAFEGTSVHDTMRRVRECELQWPESLESGGRAILQRCLQIDPTRRYASAAELFEHLQALRPNFHELSLQRLLHSAR